jgi:putative DNA methylase
MSDRRLIEDSLPLSVISKESRREKSLRHGHISTIHMWWARRPLAACRAAIYAALRPAPVDAQTREEEHKLIADLVEWESTEPITMATNAVARARKGILDASNARSGQHGPPIVLDPFAGGGSIPLEAGRLGCTAIANDLNPVAHVIELATLRFAQQFSDLRAPAPKSLFGDPGKLLLIDALEWCLERIQKEVRLSVEDLYPHVRGENVLGYIWARTVTCPNPACRAEIPLMGQWWLAKKKNKRVALRPIPNTKQGRVDFEVAFDKEIDFNPDVGSMSRSNALCPCCSQVCPATLIREAGVRGEIGYRLVSVVVDKAGVSGKSYRAPTKAELSAATVHSAQRLEQLREILIDGIPLIPDEELPYLRSIFNVHVYGYRTWASLFTPRQLVTICTFVDAVRNTRQAISDKYKKFAGERATEFAEAVTTLAACVVDRVINQSNAFTRWNNVGEKAEGIFTRQALGMLWDFVEVNPFAGATGGVNGALSWVSKVIERNSFSMDAQVIVGSAERLTQVADGTVDAVVTDPPYYDAVPYANLSDFFFVWLKRMLGHTYPDVFAGAETPKRSELVQLAERNKKYAYKTAKFFESGMSRTFVEARRVLNDSGICIVIYAHKSTGAWETLLKALLDAGLVVTASWPVETERGDRLRAQGAAALASSVFIVCRKRTSSEDGFLDDIQPQLQERLRERLDYFWTQGIRGADFFMSAIGPAVEVFGRYARVLRLSGEEVSVGTLLDQVRSIVADYALQRIVHGEKSGNVDGTSRFYVIWRWAFGVADVEAGEAIHMAQSMGCEFSDLVTDKGVLTKKGDKVSLKGPVDRKKTKGLGSPSATGVLAPLIDVLHCSANLWAAGRRQELADFLSEALPPDGLDRMHRLAQSIVDVLVPGDKERALYENFLVGARSLPTPTKKDEETNKQQRLF